MNPKQSFVSFLIVFLLFFMFSSLPSGMMTPFLTSLGYSSAQIGLLFSLGAISGILFQFILGRLCDHYRSIKPFAIVSLGFGLFSISLFYFSSSASLLVYLSGIAMSACSRLVSSLLDSWALESGESIRRNYGSIRAFGALGFSIGLGVLVVFVERYGFIAILPVCFVLGSALTVMLVRLPDVKRPVEEVREKPNLKSLFRKRYVTWLVVFFFVFFVVGVEDMTITLKMLSLGAKPGQVALYYSLQAAFELPLFFLGGRLVRRFSAKNILVVSIVALALKMAYFAASTSIGVMLAGTLIQVFTFPLIMVCSKQIIYAVSDDRQKISGQMWGVAIYGNLSGVLAPAIVGQLARQITITGSLYALGASLLVPLFLIALQKETIPTL
ncbi:MAG TPA: hypothetical protein DCP62_08460 [Erysipelotrichaceae bacterium]|nr:MAG: hypothetical protein A2Y19_03710 [Firmicutes bacterium GWE2_51_13]HAM63652.1 hypothetical protein [Erysipelotrichaceae bacterium]HAO60565.1 hypothetical protein [Erysipelotrichaceae bacterium]HBZ40410.1 hypothetical protein [Erysipelotrichaceae bacterium]